MHTDTLTDTHPPTHTHTHTRHAYRHVDLPKTVVFKILLEVARHLKHFEDHQRHRPPKRHVVYRQPAQYNGVLCVSGYI